MMPTPTKAPAAKAAAPAKTVTVPVTVTTNITADEKTIAAHVSAAVAGAAGFIALLHPGFSIPPVVEAAVVPVSWAAAAGIEVFELVTKRGLVKAIAALAASKS